PIVFAIGGDPVQAGLVASLNRPGGNITGVTNLGVEVGPKRLELAHELVSPGSLIAVLVNPSNPTNDAISRDLQAAANTLQRQIHILCASTEEEIAAAFDQFVRLRAGALVIATDAFFNAKSALFGALTLRHAAPTIHQNREFVEGGG